MKGGAVRIAILGATALLLGAIAIATGLLAVPEAVRLGERVRPILLFVVAITVVTELAAAAGLFRVVAEQLARWGLGRAWMLWLLIAALATIGTIFLSLDSTAVLLTPVVVSVARHVGLPPMPFALTTVWIANAGSLLLPVSNLTNLLAASRLGEVTPIGFAKLMAVPALVAIVVPVLIVFLVYRRQLLVRYEPQSRTTADDPVLLVIAASMVALLIPALITGVAVWIPSIVAAAVLGAAFLVRRRSELRFSLIPWQLILFASGLFLLVDAARSAGLGALLTVLAGHGDDPLSLLRVSGSGAVAANVVNNLPAYLALEPTAGSPVRYAALLIGVNAGPLVTPWASLATLLWAARLRALGVSVSWRRFALLGVIVVIPTVCLATLALAVWG